MGAGLPIISSLQGLLRTGDEIQRIEGIFSGTLSFIFNSFGPERSFSSVVTEAKNAGYTEPDPRDDLSGEQLPAWLCKDHLFGGPLRLHVSGIWPREPTLEHGQQRLVQE